MFAEFNLPVRVVFKLGCSESIGKELSAFKSKKAMICTDKGIRKAGLLDNILVCLEDSEIKFSIFDEVVPNPKIETIQKGFDFFKKEECDSIIAIGGGSSIDSAKAVGIVVSNSGSIEDFEGFNKVKNELPPIIAIPTTYGTGSEVSYSTVITHTNKKYKMLIVDNKILPKIALVDPNLLLKLPFFIAASTGMDALTHAIESYTSLISNVFSDALSLHAIKLITENLLSAAASDNNIIATSNMVIASTLAAMSFNLTGLGLVHAIAHSLGGYHDIAHGLANAILLPHVMEYNYIAAPQKFSNIYEAMGGKCKNEDAFENAENAIEKVKKLSRLLEIPCNFKEAGVPQGNIEEIAKLATRDRGFAHNIRRSCYEDIVKIIKKAYGK